MKCGCEKRSARYNVLSVDMFLSDGPVRGIVLESEIHSKSWVVNVTQRVERTMAEQ